jgi:Flp pilus assembly protein TadD
MTLDARFAAGTTALLFAVHPVMIQAAGYISGRAEVLCAAWSLGALLLLRRFAREGGARWLAFGLGAWLAALASKEIAAMVPFVLLAWRHLAAPSDAAVRQRLRILGPLVALTVLAGMARLAVLWTVENPGEARVFWAHALVELDVFRRYLQLLVAPVGQSVFHAIPPVESLASLRLVATVLLLLGLGFTAWRLRRREPLVAFGLAWFALFVLPSAVLVVVDLGEPMAEQRIYLASAGVLTLVGVALAWVRAWCGAHRPGLRLITVVLPLLLAATLFARTEARLDAWSSSIRLWEDAALNAPGAWLPQLMLGDSLDAAGRPADAIQAYRRAAELGPDQAVAHVKLGTLLMQAGDREAARQALERALQLDPSSATAQNALGALAMTGGQPEAARARFEAALAIDPRNVPARLLLAALDEQAGRKAGARRWCEEVRALAPGTPEVESCLERNAPR